MLRLDSVTQDLVKAGCAIPSLHHAIEELILNSLDANSTFIEVSVDFVRFSAEIRDNGVGIMPDCMGSLVGKFGSTSKISKPSYGFRGEALAAICMLSEVDIISKTDSKDCKNELFSKRICFGRETPELCDIHCHFPTGTTVRFTNMFGNLAVRRRATKIAYELTKVKEFVEKMSLLHHSVAWVLTDDNVRKPIFQVSRHTSVAQRFCYLHSPLTLSKMTLVERAQDGYCLSGMISPLLSDHCHWTREYQYLFINRRWTKNADFVSNFINHCFSQLLIGKSGGGPAAKHHSLDGPQIYQFPCFVLHLTCPEKDVDVNMEPDKTFINFAKPEVVQTCLQELLVNLVQRYSRELLPSFLLLLKRGGRWSGNYHLAEKDEDINVAKDCELGTYSVSLGSPLDRSRCFDGSSPQDAVFRSLFLETPEKESIRNEISDSGDSSTSDLATGVNGNVMIQVWNQSQVIRTKLTPFLFETSSEDASTESFTLATSDDASVCSEERFQSLKSLRSKEDLTKAASPFFRAKRKEFPGLTLQTRHASKEDLNSLRLIGQVDRKYLLSLTSSGDLLAFDQHAAHERINLEASLCRECDCSSICQDCFKSVGGLQIQLNESILLDSSCFYFILNKINLFSAWGFEVDVKLNDANFCLVQLSAAPSLHGEALNANDFAEFVHLIQSNASSPMRFLKPPAFSRILAMRACRSAVKFGDVLSTEQSEGLLRRLGLVKYPFQCAHGRTSVEHLGSIQTTLHKRRKLQQQSAIYSYSLDGPKSECTL